MLANGRIPRHARHHTNGKWNLLESDPAIFTELINRMGVKGLELQEIYSLDADSFIPLKPIFGLIFLFKWSPKGKNSRTTPTENSVKEGAGKSSPVLFSSQIAENACATQAVLSILLNIQRQWDKVHSRYANWLTEIDIGDRLKELRKDLESLTPKERGKLIGSSEWLRNIHNGLSFSLDPANEDNDPYLVQFDEPDPKAEITSDGDVFHFVSYVPIDGRLYELDGLLDCPLDLGEIPSSDDQENWFKPAIKAIKSRIMELQSYQSQPSSSADKINEEIRFNLMAMTKDRLLTLDIYLRNTSIVLDQALEEHQVSCDEAATSTDIDKVEPVWEDPSFDPYSFVSKNISRDTLTQYIERYKSQIKEAMEDKKRQKDELERRSHDYLPFIKEMITILARKGKLLPLV